MSEYRVRCGVCRRQRPEEETILTSGRAGGNYRRPSRSCSRRVCRACVVERVEETRRLVYAGVGAYVSEHRIDWAYAARQFGIDFADLPSSATADAIERARAYREEHNLGTHEGAR